MFAAWRLAMAPRRFAFESPTSVDQRTRVMTEVEVIKTQGVRKGAKLPAHKSPHATVSQTNDDDDDDPNTPPDLRQSIVDY